YDDGEAEFAAGLNASGARLAYYFEPLCGVADTLVSVDIYFPFVGINETAQIDLIVLRDLDDDPGSLLHMQTINVQRSGNNEFVSYPLAQAVIVSNPYYLGWRQRGTSRVDVGLDKNNNTGERMFFNVGDNWQQNVSVQGSLMIRPVIGKATGLITGVAPSEKNHVKVWPNPSHDGKFWLAGKVNAMEIRNQFGQAIRFNQTQYPDFLEIDLQDQTRGMYILRIHDGSKLQSIKLIRQ
ncbi:MAG TPA: T9SS type A sorting domain-containing protein, partial [Cyclobacteriaceae bacterium]|nr:T9SS type A sorting domain-containing protein [Cyclobacteriaceae bacterium]